MMFTIPEVFVDIQILYLLQIFTKGNLEIFLNEGKECFFIFDWRYGFYIFG